MGKKSFKPLREAVAELAESGEGYCVPSHAAFLTVKKEVEEMMADGWTAKSLWEALTKQGRITFSYPSFTRYMRRYVRIRDNAAKSKEADANQKEAPNVTVSPRGRVMPDWPKPGSGQSSVPKYEPGTYRGEIPVYGSKPKPEDFNKF